MADLVIPTFKDPFYSQRTQLDGVDFNLYFAFNSREGRWYVDIYDTGDVAIKTGVKIKANFLLASGRYAKRPAGTLVCLDLKHTIDNQLSRDPGLLELGGRWLLYYWEA